MSPKDTIVYESELPQLGQKKKPNRTLRVFGMIARLFLLLLFTLIISASVQITYDYTRYQTFYVNGESMYPTLNKDTSYTDASGKEYDGSTLDVSTWGDFTSRGATYICDYGLMDSREGFLSRLQRFDIVVTYFKNDLDSNGTPKEKADLKIKRLIALPGESFAFSNQGELTINGESVAQPESIYHLEKTTTYRSSLITSGTLGPDEYFLCGDNRTNSTDSRIEGAVTSACLVGEAIAVIGKCSCYIPTDSSADPVSHPLWNRFLLPWEIRWLS